MSHALDMLVQDIRFAVRSLRRAPLFVLTVLVIVSLGTGVASAMFGISTTDPPTYVVVALILVLSAGLAAWVPAYRATRVDPMRALRCD